MHQYNTNLWQHLVHRGTKTVVDSIDEAPFYSHSCFVISLCVVFYAQTIANHQILEDI